MNSDDKGKIPLPAESAQMVETISSSGMPITDYLLKGFEPQSNHPSGGFFGPRACGENFGALLRAHPVYIDPQSSLAGGYMVNFGSYRKVRWNPDFDYSHLHEAQEKYQLITGIGSSQHFCQDLSIGLELGWGGLLEKIRRYRKVNAPQGDDFYAGLEAIVLGVQDWIARTAEEARRLAAQESDPQVRQNLEQMADINARLIEAPPRTFREACQWMLWYQITARMYNGSGSLGRLDCFLQPYYEQDVDAGILTDEEAVFHIACLLLRDTAYVQLGGLDGEGQDVTNPVSFLVLEAAHQLRIPANVGVSVGKHIDPHLLKRGVEIMFEDKTGLPKFLGIDSVVEGFAKNGYPVELARQRVYSGCHWHAIPGREHAMMDCIKINLGTVFDVALREMMAQASIEPSVDQLWRHFKGHLRRAIDVIAQGIDIHLAHKHEVHPELVLDLCCYGPLEKGLDASYGGDATSEGGVEYYNPGVDGAALATVADSFAAIEQRVEKEQRLTWDELMHHLDQDWAGAEGERVRLMMRQVARYGSGGSRADAWAARIARAFTEMVKEKPTPNGFDMIPGLFSWANTISLGKGLGATPNGRRAGQPISHGTNPDPGFRKDAAPTAMAVAVAAVQPGYGNTAPMQIELDPGLGRDAGSLEKIACLIRTHFELGGTQINMNIVDADKILAAHEDPSRYPDLIVRVTGFSAYFASLSPEFRQLVVDRMIREA